MKKFVAMMFALCLITSFVFAQVDQATGTLTNDATQARLRIGNFIYNAPNFDVFINGEIAVNGNVPQANIPGFANGYIYLAPGTYSVAVASAGRGLEAAKFGPVDVTLEADHRYTLGMMGKIKDEQYTPLLIDETAVLDQLGASPGQSVLFLVNNLAGTEAIDFDQEGEGPKDVDYGSFGAAPISVGQGKKFVYTASDGQTILEGTSWYRPEGQADVMVALMGSFPGYPGIKLDFVESQRTSDLNVIDFLKGYSDAGFQAAGHPVSFGTFLTLIETAGLSETLATGGPHLVYTPTDEAFAVLPQEQLDALIADPEAASELVRYHVAEGYYSYGSLVELNGALVPRGIPASVVVTNLLGMELEHRNDGTINGASSDVVSGAMVSNGTRVRAIGRLLLPPE